MIDLLFLEVALAFALLWAANRLHLTIPRLFLGLLAAAFACHAGGVSQMYMAPPHFFHTGAATSAGNKIPAGGGEVLAVDGKEVRSLGELLSSLRGPAGARLRTSRGEYSLPVFAADWNFWEAGDSYLLEELSGGLWLAETKPVVRRKSQMFDLQLNEGMPRPGWRIVISGGKPVGTVTEFLRTLEGVPEKGLLALRGMSPTPDNSLSTVFFSPSALPADPELPQETFSQRIAAAMGMDGLVATIRIGSQSEVTDVVRAMRDGSRIGLREFLRWAAQAKKESASVTFNLRGSNVASMKKESLEIWARPRLALFPWWGENVLSTVFAGFAGLLIRPFAALADLPLLLRYWDYLPKQAYLLDDLPARFPGFFFFKLSSVLVSLVYALLLWEGLRRILLGDKRKKSRSLAPKAVFVLSVFLVFELGLVFVMHLLKVEA